MYFSSQVDEYLYMLKYALLSTFLCFVLPLGVLIIGILVILWQREKNKSIVLPVIAAIATEAAALVPLIGVLFFTDDGVIYGVCLFFNVTYMLTLLSPLTILLICIAIYLVRKRNNSQISKRFYIVSALLEIVSLAVTVLIIIKDIYG